MTNPTLDALELLRMAADSGEILTISFGGAPEAFRVTRCDVPCDLEDDDEEES